MKKRSRTYRISRAIITAVALPVVLLWLLIVLLYIPPVQRYAVKKVCSVVGDATGFDVNISSFHLAFPLKLSITDFEVSRNDTLFAHGEKAAVNVSFMPLLSGEVEVNYVSLEKTSLNTADLIEGMRVDGEIGFFRIVARNINLEDEVANLRQIHLHSTEINLTLNDTTESVEEESEPLGWVVNLHRGGIENCRFTISMPLDTMGAALEVGKLRIRRAGIDLGKEAYGIDAVALSNAAIRYDSGIEDKEKAPMQHLEFNNVNLALRDIAYTPDSTKLTLSRFTLIQPGGIRITEGTARLVADRQELDIDELSVKSRNGSYIAASTVVPWNAVFGKGEERLDAFLSLAVNKKDLAALLTAEQYGALSLFEDDMLKGKLTANGNMSYMEFDTIDINVPTIIDMQGNGHARNLMDMKTLEASIGMKSRTGDLRKFMGEAGNDSIPYSSLTIDGDIAYVSETAKADLVINGIGGSIGAKALYDINNEAYNADIEMQGIDITTLMPDIPLSALTAKLNAYGEGFDIFSEKTKYDIKLSLDTLVYDRIELNSIALEASQHNSLSDIQMSGDAKHLKFMINAGTILKENDIRNTTSIDISKADLMMLGITDAELTTSMKLDIKAATDMQESHALKLDGKDIEILVQNRRFTPEDIAVDFSTNPDSSYIIARNGDLDISGTLESGYTGLFSAFEKIGRMFEKASKAENTLYYIHDYEKELPAMTFNFSCGNRNMLYNYLAMNDMSFNDMKLRLALDSVKGLNMNSGIYGFRTGDMNLDTIRAFTRQEGNVIRYLAGVRSTAIDPQMEKLTFSAMLHGNIFNDSVTTNFLFRDKKESAGIRFGFKTLIKPRELDISFRPDAVFFNEKFMFDEGNYINIGTNSSIRADVAVANDEDAGMHLYAMPDEVSRLNANLELFNVNLKKLTSMLPFVPEIAGMLNLDLYFRDGEEDMLLSSDIRIDSVAYEGTHIGDEALEVVYFPKGKNTHYLDVILNHNNEEVAHINGDYMDDENDPGLHGKISLTKFPLDITHAFTKDAGMAFNGYINSELNADGRFSALTTDGFLQFDSVYINAPVFGTDLHLTDKKVNIKDNRITFNSFDIFAKGDNPFKLNGHVDLSNLTDPTFNLRMNASDYELINAPRRKGSMLYGRMFMDLRAFIGGTLNSMKIYGNATLLGKSNITYVMQDSPIESDKELDGLVEFVNFNDTTRVEEVTEEANLGNTNISLSLKIEEGARINADFDANRTSYVMLQGGGNLNMTYTSDNGLNVTGTYAMNEGELKYALPIIPLKTFNIVEGSKVTWNGDMLDPSIDITALERITTSVSLDDGGMQPVAFDVGVKLSNTLSNMGLTFTISAPDNAVVQDQLNSLDAETLNKYAVTMLITGTYIGNAKGMTVSNALSSFIDAKINDLAGSAMKSVSVNVGINDAENAETGSTYKNYSFSLKKRFLNDKLTIIIGGEVNSGDNPTSNNSFINNVSLEWKISDSGNRYLRLFYDKNYESLLEGEIIETGIGYIYKRKLENLRELFIFKKKDEKPVMPERGRERERDKHNEENGTKRNAE